MDRVPANFLYYEPRSGGNQVYFGTGVIRAVYEDTEEPNHYYAELGDYRPLSAVSYYDGPNDQPWEEWKTMRNSVRRIEAATYESILQIGNAPRIITATDWNDSVERLQEALRKSYRPHLSSNPPRLRKVQRILETFERPSRITNCVKAERGDICQLCGQAGFLMRNGRRYCEVHHLFHLSDDPPAECLEPFYVVVLCATCHRRMHYAEVGQPIRVESGWRIAIDGTVHEFVTR